jgi:hypothetical protein
MRNARPYSTKTNLVLTLTAALFIAYLTCNTVLVSATIITVDGDPSDWTGIAPALIDANDYLYDQLESKKSTKQLTEAISTFV